MLDPALATETWFAHVQRVCCNKEKAYLRVYSSFWSLRVPSCPKDKQGILQKRIEKIQNFAKTLKILRLLFEERVALDVSVCPKHSRVILLGQYQHVHACFLFTWFFLWNPCMNIQTLVAFCLKLEFWSRLWQAGKDFHYKLFRKEIRLLTFL